MSQMSLYAALAASAAALRSSFQSLVNSWEEEAGREAQAAAVFKLSQCVGWSDEAAAMYRRELTLRCCLTQHLRLTLQSSQPLSLSRPTAALYLSCCSLRPFMQAQRLADIQRAWQHESDALRRF